jgi:hypothetical protein
MGQQVLLLLVLLLPLLVLMSGSCMQPCASHVMLQS